MYDRQDRVRVLTDRCQEALGDLSILKPPRGYPDGMALCVIDSIQATGVRYGSVGKVADRYRRYRAAQGGDATSDGVDDLVATFEVLGGPDGWAKAIGNRNRTSTQANAPLKAVAIQTEAQRLLDLDIVSTRDFRAAVEDPDRIQRVRSSWLSAPSQSSGITWQYVQMLAGVPGVKPDRMIRRFVANALDVPPRTLSGNDLIDLVTAVAEASGISATALDHAIWGWQHKPARPAVPESQWDRSRPSAERVPRTGRQVSAPGL